MTTRRLQIDPDTQVGVELHAPATRGGHWTAVVADDEANDWLVTLAHGTDADEAVAALSVTLRRYGRRRDDAETDAEPDATDL